MSGNGTKIAEKHLVLSECVPACSPSAARPFLSCMRASSLCSKKDDRRILESSLLRSFAENVAETWRSGSADAILHKCLETRFHRSSFV